MDWPSLQWRPPLFAHKTSKPTGVPQDWTPSALPDGLKVVIKIMVVVKEL